MLSNRLRVNYLRRYLHLEIDLNAKIKIKLDVNRSYHGMTKLAPNPRHFQSNLSNHTEIKLDVSRRAHEWQNWRPTLSHYQIKLSRLSQHLLNDSFYPTPLTSDAKTDLHHPPRVLVRTLTPPPPPPSSPACLVRRCVRKMVGVGGGLPAWICIFSELSSYNYTATVAPSCPSPSFPEASQLLSELMMIMMPINY